MFTSAELERFSMLLDKPMNELEQRIMSDIIRRIRQNGEITRAADWQISRLYQLGVSYDEIDAAIAQALGLSDKELEALYSDIISKGYARDKGLYDKTGVPFIPFEENEELRQLISSVAEQTGKTLKNITGSLGFAVNTPGGICFLPIAKYYQRTLDDAMLDIASGAFDYNTVLKRVVSEMTNSGLRTVDYASGHSNRVEVAARRALQTGIGQLADKVNNDNAKALDTDYFEVTVSRCARPAHAVWQGRVYSSNDLVSVCGYGRVDGLCGANCHHDKHPFIPGISERAYTDEELDEIIRQENTPREWNGKQYTAYEATQRQRRLETTMRAQRQKIKLLEEGGADEDTLTEARARYRTTSAEYSRFSNACGIPQQRERVTVDGLGAIGNKPIDNSKKSGIIKAIKIDDFDETVEKGVITEECKETIFNTMKEQGVTFAYDDVITVNIPADKENKIEPFRTNAVSSPGYPKVVLEINQVALAGKTKDRIDKWFEMQEFSVINSLEEAIIHESAHAKVINGLTYAQYEALNEELKGSLFTDAIIGRQDGKSLKDLAGEISKYAQKDGLECIAECHVILSRGESIPKELKDLHDKYVK